MSYESSVVGDLHLVLGKPHGDIKAWSDMHVHKRICIGMISIVF